jgi:phage terminase small subunit
VAGSLTPKQARFVEEYLIDLNATQAAIRAGYSPRTANEQGAQLLAKLSVADAVAQAQAERSERTQVTADAVLRELARIGFEDMGTFARWGERGVTFNPSGRVDTRCVAEIRETHTKYGINVTFKLHDKVAALEKIGRHLGMFKENVSLSGEVEHTVTIESIRKALGLERVMDFRRA